MVMLAVRVNGRFEAFVCELFELFVCEEFDTSLKAVSSPLRSGGGVAYTDAAIILSEN